METNDTTKLTLKLLTMAVLLSACPTCVVYSPAVQATTVPSAERAHVFGRFALIETVGVMGISLTVKRENWPNTYNIRLVDVDKASAVYAVSVVPGQYKITSIGFRGPSGYSLPRPFDPADKRLADVFTVEPGDCIYIGDYVGSITYAGYTYAGNSYDLRIHTVRDNGAETKEDFTNAHPLFAEVNYLSIFEQ